MPATKEREVTHLRKPIWKSEQPMTAAQLKVGGGAGLVEATSSFLTATSSFSAAATSTLAAARSFLADASTGCLGSQAVTRHRFCHG